MLINVNLKMKAESNKSILNFIKFYIKFKIELDAD
jgi:hypothetical protein